MSTQDFIDNCIKGYTEIVKAGMPVAFLIAACNIAFNIIITAFCGGSLHIGRDTK